jgi:hypothetical protein
MTSAKAVPTIALISHSSVVSQVELQSYVPPYQAYVDEWLARFYPVSATIAAPVDGRKPRHAWPIYFADQLNEPGAAGFHTDSHQQPTSYVDANQEPLFTGSHELAEMLVDPSGNSLYAAPSPDPADRGKEVHILDEVCDPCEDRSLGVQVAGVLLSDFITPKFGDSSSGPYDAAEGLTAPREVFDNGYISWIDERVWKQATNFQGEGFKVRVLGPAGQAKNEGKSLREWVDEQTRRHIAELAAHTGTWRSAHSAPAPARRWPSRQRIHPPRRRAGAG